VFERVKRMTVLKSLGHALCALAFLGGAWSWAGGVKAMDEKAMVKAVVWHARSSLTARQFVETFPFSPSVRLELNQYLDKQNASNLPMPEVEYEGNSFILYLRGQSFGFSFHLKPAAQLKFSDRVVTLANRSLAAIAKDIEEVVLKEMTRQQRNSRMFFKELLWDEAHAIEYPQVPSFVVLFGMFLKTCATGGLAACSLTDVSYIIASKKAGALVDFSCPEGRVESIDLKPFGRRLKFEYGDDQDRHPLKQVVDGTERGALCTYKLDQDMKVREQVGRQCVLITGRSFESISASVPIDSIVRCCRRGDECFQEMANADPASSIPSSQSPSSKRSKAK
jgi:hypothetical protein